MKIGAKPFIGQRVILINATKSVSYLEPVKHQALLHALPKQAICLMTMHDLENLAHGTIWSHNSFDEILPEDDWLPEYEVAMFDSGDGLDYRSGLVLSGQSWTKDDLTRFRMPGSMMDVLLNIEESNHRPD